jgi:2-polyprenyl-3-methyl-5-hydroxy-6-metoxy-1,4-benzoquinol methylase
MNFCCRVCQSTNIRQILDLGDQPWGNDFLKIEKNLVNQRYPLIFVICEICKISQINYTIPKEKMFKNHSYMSGTTKTLSLHFSNISEQILKKFPLKENEYVLDIGGNDGTFLENFKKKNIRVLNVDSGIQQSILSNQKGIECINDYFNEKLASKILVEKGQASIIHGSNIFFHLEELSSAFKGVKKLLKKDGVIIAEFIDLKSMMEKLAFDQIYHEHLLYYSLTTFNNMLKAYDLEIFDAQLYSIHGGSYVTFIKHKEFKFKHTPNLKLLLQEEINYGILRYEPYENFAKQVLAFKFEILELLKNLKSQGKTIYALGAPVKGSTMINYLKLERDLLDCAVEINPYKFETYYPGTKIPVVNQETVRDPDYYFMLSWNFQDEIISKMSTFVKRGGKFIIPFPNIKIV